MLKIFYGSESCAKEKFIFDNINPEKKTIVIVPDQFSLQMERDALDYYKAKTGQTALINLIVADFSSLGRKVVKEAGGKEPELIDKYGRHMLLSVLIERLVTSGALGVYKNMGGRNSFTANANQLISEMKRFGTTPSDLESAINKTDSFLKLKLQDLNKIFGEYQNSIEGRFIDSEDYISFYGKLMTESELIKNAEIWIYGFDTFTPLNMEVIRNLLKTANCVNVMLTKDDKMPMHIGTPQESPATSQDCDARILTAGDGEGLFSLVDLVMERLKELDEDAAVTPLTYVGDGCHDMNCEERKSIWNDKPESKITLVCATNIYSEADRVAAHIVELVRDRGYRYGDITVICNDMDVRGGVLKRTFDRWKIPAFADRKRKVLHQPVVRFLLSFLDVITDGYEGDCIMKMVSTGMMGWSRSDEELLTNYINEANIRGGKWKQEFTWTGSDDYEARYSETDLARLNEIRRFIVNITEGAKKEIGKRNSAEEKVTGLYSFLESQFEIKDRISGMIDEQIQLGLVEGAAETAQSWNMICSLFKQILRIIGEENISNVQLRDLIGAGLEEMEIGLVPTSTDCVVIGTLQRTRVSKTRSLIITSANEGILPLQASDTGLLTNKELDSLEELKLNISKKEDVRCREEQLAIYRMFSLPQDELFVTYSLADQDGKSTNPSGIFTVLKELCAGRMLGDLGADDVMDKVISRSGTLPFVAGAMQNFIENGEIDDVWITAINWYLENDSDNMSKIFQGLCFDNKIDALGEELSNSLYFGDRDKIVASASRLELYSSCPFKHFIRYGLKAQEGRKFEIDPRSKGDVFHMTLRRLSECLMPPEGTDVCDDSSDWMTITEEECRKQVEEILLDETTGYREGVYVESKESQLQLQRVIENCGDIAWAMIGQVRKSNMHRMYFEESFGYSDSRFAPIEVELEGGKKAVLAGKIDRIDVIGVSEAHEENGVAQEAIRIIDYKTGSDIIDRQQIEEGYKLQLTIYVNAVCGSSVLTTDTSDSSSTPASSSTAEPAGIFYFKIKDFDVNADIEGTPNEKGDSVEERIAGACRLEGILVDNESIIKAMDQTVENGISSTVVPLQKLKDGTIKPYSAGELMSNDEFKELCSKTAEHVKRICHEIQQGNIDIAPKMERKKSGDRKKTSCTYCEYKSICLFDTSFRQCRYELV